MGCQLLDSHVPLLDILNGSSCPFTKARERFTFIERRASRINSFVIGT
jgi:hypothetical protein